MFHKKLIYTGTINYYFFFFFQDETHENVTLSELSFVPTTEDDGKEVTCRAENPNVSGLYLESKWTIDVVCKYNFYF